jgi:hypothetical protein
MTTTPPFLFVVGCGRSGTTLLRSMLDSHPDVAIPRESYFIETMLRRRDGYRRGETFDVDSFLKDLVADVRFLRWDVDPDEIAAGVRRAGPTDLAAAIRTVYREFARARGATRAFDKTPLYALCIPAIAKLLPEARFAHLVRDGRDVVSSYLQNDWGPRSLVSAAAHWKRVVRAADRARELLGPDRVREFRYEDLTSSPERTLRDLCDFAELEFAARLLDFGENMKTRPRLQPAATRIALAGPVRTDIRSWIRDMEDSDIATVEVIAGAELRAHGYRLSGFDPGAVGRAGVHTRAAVSGALYRAELAARRTRISNRLRPMRGVWPT